MLSFPGADMRFKLLAFVTNGPGLRPGPRAAALLRRLPGRIDRIGGALEAGRLSVNVRLLADEGDRRIVTGLLYLVLTTFLAATSGIMAVLMLGLRGGPTITSRVSLFQFLGYCLLVISATLALRVLALVFRPNRA